MIIKHNGNVPSISAEAYIAPDATISGNVIIGRNSIVTNGARIIAEGGQISIGENCIILENAVLRSTNKHNLTINNNVLIGPNSHVVGCIIEDNVFVATGASIFHGARLCEGSEVRINGVVHIKTTLSKGETVPIGWIAVGDPIMILPPDRNDDIWKIQKPLNFPQFVYDIERPPKGQSNMPEICKMMSKNLLKHKNDEIIG